jgi:cytochrome c oxidase accessory protein FixG
VQGYLKGWVPYRKKREVFFVLLTIISLGLPFIKFNDNHFFLLNFDKYQLHLFFVRFDMQELYLLPFLLILLFLGVFFMTTLGGRVWCGWICPQTIFRVWYRDYIETSLLGLRKNVKNKQKDPDMSLPGNKAKKTIAILIWSALSVVAASNFMWYFVPPEDFFTYIQSPADHTVLIGFILGLAAFLIYDVIRLKEDFCIYVCPYARVQSVMYDEDTIQTIYNTHRGGEIYALDEKTGQPIGEMLYKKQKELQAVVPNAECTTCESCVTICPTHIDIRKGTQLECLNCLECADACTKVMGALGKPSLITWTSLGATKEERKVKFFRFRTVAYAIALAAAFVALMVMSTTKEFMLLNINRTTQLYKVQDDGRVDNLYTFLFQNTDSKDHTYFFEVTGADGIEIRRPKEPFKLIAGKKVKKIVTLSTNQILVKDATKDTPIPIIIKAYAVDNKEKIVVFRESTFVYPRLDQLKK